MQWYTGEMDNSKFNFPDWLNFTTVDFNSTNVTLINETWEVNETCCGSGKELLFWGSNKAIVAGCWIYIVSSLLALVANTVVLVLLRRRGKQRSLFDLTVASLVIADLLTSVTFLVGTAVYLVYLDTNRPLSQLVFKMMVVLDATTTYCFTASLLHIFLITVEQMGALFNPLKYRRTVTKHRVKVVIASIWLLSFVPVILCFLVLKNIFQQKILGIVIFASGGLLIAMYLVIAIRLLSLKRMRKTCKMERRVLANSLAVTLSFLVCLFPFAVTMVKDEIRWYVQYGYLSASFVSLKLFLDPVLYFFVSFYKGRKAEKKRFRALTLATFYNFTVAASNNNLCNELDVTALRSLPSPQRDNRAEFAAMRKNEDFQKWISRMKTMKV